MAETNVSSVSSGHYADMQTSVASVPGNKVLLDNISSVYNYKDIIQFPMSFLRKYENIIKTNLVDYKIDPSRYYRPEYVSWDLYGTTDLWYLILFVNDLTSPMELNFEDIKVPNSLYILEIINKLKNIDKVKSTHKEPTYIYQSLLKDINSPSEKIKPTDNSFVPNPSISFEDRMEDLRYTYFEFSGGSLSRDIYYDVNSEKNYSESPVNFGFIPNLETYKVLSTDVSQKEMKLYKKLKSNTVYYLFKRYVGEMDLTIMSDDDSFKNTYHSEILKNERIDMSPVILTYDLREATLAPEFLKENLILNLDDKIYEPEIIANSNGEECYGIVINGNKYEIFFDGTNYYIVLSEDIKKNEKTIAILENKDYDSKGNQLNTYHSMNEWIFNDSNSPLIKIDDDKESSDLYFNEEYYYKYGEYVYSMKYNAESLKQAKTNNINNNITYRIDINRDLATNNNKLSRYQFLGFEFETGLSYSKLNILDDEDNDIKLGITNGINFSPLVITIVTNELDENDENIKYTFSYPYGLIPENVILNKTNDHINFLQDYIDVLGNYNDLQFNMFKYKRIIPIINNFKDKELIDIKEILVSTNFSLNDYIDINDVNFTGEFTISCGKLKVFGLRYEDLVTEIITPKVNTDIAKYSLYYKYSYDDTKYSLKNETRYFEPYLFEYNDNIMDKLSDTNNLDYVIVNNFDEDFAKNNGAEFYSIGIINENKITKKIESISYNLSDLSILERLNGRPDMFINITSTLASSGKFNKIEFINYKLKKYIETIDINNRKKFKMNQQFSLENNYSLDFNIKIKYGDNSFINDITDFDNNKVFLNGYTLNTNLEDVLLNKNKNIFHNNFQFCFDILDKDYYFLNFGELNYLTNNNTFKKNLDYKNTNLYLKNFNSYPFAVDIEKNGGNKDIYSKFKNIYVNENKTDFKRLGIFLKINNETYSLPGGVYKVLNQEGTNIYQPYKYIDHFIFKTYPICQTKIFSNNYLNTVQNNIKVKTITPILDDTAESTISLTAEGIIYFRIKKINGTYYIYYKFNEKDEYKNLITFNDFYKIINNGTLGFNFINMNPSMILTITDYRIGKTNE